MPEAGAFYVMDRGYIDFQRLYVFTLSSAFFVVRTKSNVLLQRRYSSELNVGRFGLSLSLESYCIDGQHYVANPDQLHADDVNNLEIIGNFIHASMHTCRYWGWTALANSI